MEHNEIKRTIIDADYSESFKKCEAALISNINNLLNIGEDEKEHASHDPFDPAHSQVAVFCLERAPLISTDLPTEQELPWSFDSQSLRKFNQELRELVLEGEDQELPESPNLSRFIPAGIFEVKSSEKNEGIQELPGFFSKII